MRVAWSAVALLPFVAGAESPRITLEAGTLPGVDGEARCGHHEVFENREVKSGRTIRLFVAVLPAKSLPAAPDPLFVIAGGPGQGASSIAGFASRAFALVRERRDIVLVDIAGTGRSGPLKTLCVARVTMARCQCRVYKPNVNSGPRGDF